jgi:RimJ/RimL family protein N-acetyltransferase
MDAYKPRLSLPTRFETDRLILRCYQPGDGSLLYAVSQKNREHLQRYESENFILTIKNEEHAESMVRNLAADWAGGLAFFMGAFDKNTQDFIAQIYIGYLNRDLPELQIGYFVDVDHEGLGYVTEAVKAALAFIFEHLEAHRARLECDDTNARSYRVAERCGFIREGHLRENHKNPDSTFTGTFIYGMLRSEYKRLKFEPGTS